MITKLSRLGITAVVVSAGVCLLGLPAAHSSGDTSDGPVVTAAKTALEKGDVTPALKWVKKDREAGIREAFQKTLAVRKLGPEAKELADNYFLNTLVRTHRAGTAATCPEQKPSGDEVEAAVAKADEALISGRVQPLAKALADGIAEGIRKRFERAHAAKENADSNADAGREYVEAYVEFIGYIERVAHTAKPPAAERKQ